MDDCILKCNGLKKTFPSPHGEIQVLCAVDMHVYSGESVSIRGESGSGKSTLLSILSALERPNAGTLFWRGESVLERTAAWQARYRSTFMGMVFQAYYLIPELNALENVCMAGRIAGKFDRVLQQRAEELLVRVGLQERLQHLTYQLSGGECQRVAIARALLNRPQLLLADEPTGNLDEKTGEVVMDILLRLCSEEQTAMLLVTHNPEFASRTDRKFHLKAGALDRV